jgi:hypothetical protein
MVDTLVGGAMAYITKLLKISLGLYEGPEDISVVRWV